MEMTGERRIPASRLRVWEALNDPEALRQAIPGCESVERTAEDQFQARVAVKLGPMSAKFGGKVKLENLNPPASYTITGEGSGGAMGFAKGGADVALDEIAAEETLLRYQVKAQVGGKIAQLGARLIDSTAKQMADQFFDRFAANLTPPAPVEVPAIATAGETMATTRGAADTTPVEGTDTEYLGSPERLATSPMTHHGVPPVTTEGATGLSPRPSQPADFRPLRTFASNPLGIPIQAWIGSVILLAIAALMFL